MKHIVSTISLAFFCSLLWAQEITLQEKAETLASDQVFKDAIIGVQVMNYMGDTLAVYNGNKMLNPASNMKLLSTAAALYDLGAAYKFETHIAYDGDIKDGILYGDLYIVGGADPTIGSKDTLATDLNTIFGKWADGLRKAGINRIEGRIIGDGRWMNGMSEEPTWQMSDLGTYYGTGITGLMFYENMLSFSVSAGPEVGSKVSITPHYPSTSWMTFRYNCTTGEKGSGDKLYMYTSEFAPIAEIRGTFGVDTAAKRLDCSNEFPEYTCAVYFKNFLSKNGIECTEGVCDFKFKNEWLEGKTIPEGKGISGQDLNVLCTTFSPSLERIAFATNHASNNLYAETLLRSLGKKHTGNSSYESSYKAIDEILTKLHLNSSKGIHMVDGSGLSRQNLVSADFFCRLLGAMMDSPCFETFIGSLPIPGGNGSLNYNMKGYSEAFRSRIRVKSGSMYGVRCYSGYVLPEGFTYKRGEPIPQEIKEKITIFSILTNNCTSPNWKVRPMLDKFMAEIAK